MIDPRFANAGGVPLVAGYGAQQVPVQYHHHRHHRHHKQKVRNDASPISLDESIHKVDHGHHHHHHQQQQQQQQQHQQQHQHHPHYHHHMQQNEAMQMGGGYGVPYGAAGYPQQQQYGGNNYAYANQYQGGVYGQVPYGGNPGGQTVKHRRRHNRHHRHHTADGINTVIAGEQDQPVPEQLIGQRSSSVLGDEGHEIRSPVPSTEDKASDGQVIQHRRRRHHRHHHANNAEQAASSFGQTHQSRHSHGRTSVGADGYGHINEDLIFIERGDHSPHRQEPPPGYEYKGKIEVQGINREVHSASRGASSVPPPMTISQTVTQPTSIGPCPPGWQQMVLGAPGAPCPSGGMSYTGQLMGAPGVAQVTANAYSGVAALQAAGGYGAMGASMPYASQCQMVADYIFGANAGGIPSGYQQAPSTGYTEQYQTQQVAENVVTRPTIIEVWQRRSKTEGRERSHSRSHHRSRTPAEGAAFDFERFRSEILSAIERMVPRGGAAPDIQWIGRDGGTQTEIHPTIPGEPRIEHERRPTSSGEVRVIVQPIQPVFYMPRQTGGGTPTPQIAAGPAPVIHQAAASGAPNIVYVPRNVYVPVIKPVFVPRERVIVRPQVIHVARPVLVDRPVPVTQRPIIIDRERPIPVPVRGGQAAGAAQAAGSKVVREEYVYRDNLPVAYGGRCAEFAGGVNYGYMPTQQEHQYANSSTHEVSNIYQSQGAGINVNVPPQFQHSQTSSHHEVQNVDGSFHGSYSNLANADHYGGGINNDYLAAQQGQQYASSSTHESADLYQSNQYQNSRSGSHLNLAGVGGGGGGSFHGSYSNLSGINNATAINVGQRNQEVLRQTFQQSAQVAGVPVHCPTQIEVLDTAVNPFWQKTDQPTLIRRYGRPAFEIVHKSAEVEQQMYSELRQRESNAGIVRSASAASYGSGSGIGVSGGILGQY